VGDAQGSWSSDTSSDDDLPSPEWRGPRHQQFPSLVNFEDVDDGPILSSPDDEAGSDGALPWERWRKVPSWADDDCSPFVSWS
jgi:hypothetical protein